tara:strand:+ start:1397 stop:2119 length:723 start_codon:yes stop_codon:yes gene_type:complete
MQMRSNAYIFDVDGTLTPSRQFMDAEFKAFFLEFASANHCYIATGSDYSKSLEQLGEEVMHAVVRSYNCSGNSVWEKGKSVYTAEWKLQDNVRKFLEDAVENSHWKIRTGTHIEQRPGMVNFSVLGRGATPDQRALYVDYDTDEGERSTIAAAFNKKFNETGIIAQVAGETGLDITITGKDKRQIISDFDDVNVLFFGDMMQPGGNDEPLANAIKERSNPNDGAIWVKDWEHTFSILKDI